jgi:exopolysaccharide production protein ExoZ
MAIIIKWLIAKLEIERGGQENIRCLEGMRGVAVLLVFFVHYIVLGAGALHEGTWTYGLASGIHNIGHTGVDLFFVLSGFLIYGSLIQKPKPILTYLARRIERIYPTFLVVLGLYVLLSFVFLEQSKIPADPLQAILYLVENLLLLPGIFPLIPIIAVSWSLSYEMFYYLCVPLAISGLRLRSWSPVQRLYLFIAISAGFILYCAFYGGLVRLAMFGAGIVLYELLAIRDFENFPNGAGIVAWAVGMLIILFIPQEQMGIFMVQSDLWSAIRTAVLFISLFLLCLDSFSNHKHLTARLFSFAPIRYFGNISYSYFLIHGLTLKAFFWLLGMFIPVESLSSVGFWVGVPVAFCLTVVSSLVLYLLVERPLSIFPARTRRISPIPLVELPPQ